MEVVGFVGVEQRQVAVRWVVFAGPGTITSYGTLVAPPSAVVACDDREGAAGADNAEAVFSANSMSGVLENDASSLFKAGGRTVGSDSISRVLLQLQSQLDSLRFRVRRLILV